MLTPYVERKINCITLEDWNHHFGGWNYIVEILKDLHSSNGIDFFTNGIFNRIYRGGIIATPWIGVCHFGLEEVKSINFEEIQWTESFRNCKGIIVHSEIIRQYMSSVIPNVPIQFIPHSTKTPTLTFDLKNFNHEIWFVGRYLRRQDRFNELNCEFAKKQASENNHLANEAYEQMLACSLVFLDMYDCSCSNTIIECLVRDTPMLICKLPTIVEYLGESYPMYFESIDEINSKANDISLIEAAYKYLKRLDKNRYNRRYYFNSFVNSFIYQNL